ncbi:MAG: bifunctional DNA-formamidopyrimidine glycosylase/DNA-(apurinic or apyrimidinic site) lyase [Patescibacteria group bacterium]
MPELPEVQTTVSGLQKVLPNLAIKDVWTDWKKTFRENRFHDFKKAIVGKKVLSVTRRGKHILIRLTGNITIIIHMKMTGHLLYGKYKHFPHSNVLKNVGMRKTENERWVPAEKGPLNDPFNRFIHVVFSLSNGKHLAFSDMRKFGKIVLEKMENLKHSPHLAHLGPEPLEKGFCEKNFFEQISKKPRGKIKTVLMDQTIVAGIGNIYSDEMLWRAGIHPETKTGKLKDKKIKELFSAMKEILRGGIKLGGDSMSDYRNIFGERGHFQEKHHAYQKNGKRCDKRGCGGIIERKVVGGRSAHFCPKHQK